METLLGIAVGLGLAAACGFRVFVPLLVASAATRWGHLDVSSGFEWLGSLPALVAFGTATVLEIAAYSIPWLDHALDIIATPAAVVAGVVASAAAFVDLPAPLKWTLAVIAGGGAAGIVQGATVLTRVKSTAVTGGLANPIVSAVEAVGSATTSVLAVALPALLLIAVVVFCVVVFRVAGRFAFGRVRTEPPHAAERTE